MMAAYDMLAKVAVFDHRKTMALWQWQVEMIGVINFHGQRSHRVVEANETDRFNVIVEG